MKPADRVRLLRDILLPERETTVVDIGANPFNGTPPYALLRRSGICRIVGFEPQPEALIALNERKGERDVYLPYAVGTGGKETLYLTRNSGLVSVLSICPWVGDYLNPWWQRASQIERKIEIVTKRLDDIEEIHHIDFLKIDIQGGELKVFQNGRRKLSDCAVVQTEVAILPYYEGQPTFGDIQAEMASQGFIAHKFVEVSAHHLRYPLKLARGIDLPKSQATVADIVFLRNPIKMAAMKTETIRQMAIVADAVLRSFDLVIRCLGELIARDVLTKDAVVPYIHALKRV